MSVSVNCHIDEDTPVSAGQLSASGTWTVDIGGGDDMVILFASADRMRRLAHEILDAIPAEGEGIDHARAACPYPAGCTGCVPEEHLEPCGCPTDLVADCGHQEGCERDGFDEPTLVDGGIVHLEPCGCPTDLVADCGHQEGCERDGFDEPTLVDGGIVL